jgi:hypothetical protein
MWVTHLHYYATALYYVYTSKINSKFMQYPIDTEPKTIEEMMDDDSADEDLDRQG